ncbi:(2Fe-2S)-binding protein [Desulfosporosinus sp. BICA1-9]|uniref:(2Fe-2S)-binding protein n=1 Tax=Desulfosporosinus sp. BICA1-9 TaxID=1531958 RepID=UPI00054B1A4F|nr:(2Fe-2S)-binding protein [Desulfosporosinus sp. BICA1-9]KJS50609.1 MAG: (2Fe-2S)-binding protein [Peptococcaceae bacterium BRH_c23]KJS86117.1 MAG: (2Fe-2S)-binding protein [Desulfosporosinus sp. BICA1-9]HBW34359.1 (2Fe-2S)-binding protein [Desulfosporosinus sp.]
MQIEFKLNGKEYNMEVSSTLRLVDLLREELGLTGTKEGCGEGECGSCTVIMNGKAVNSCLVLALQIRGQEILTIEALEKDGQLDKLQHSFIQNGAVQCGYCTPGMLMSAKALLMTNPNPTDEEIKISIAGNLCRCTGYNKIVTAIKEAADGKY